MFLLSSFSHITSHHTLFLVMSSLEEEREWESEQGTYTTYIHTHAIKRYEGCTIDDDDDDDDERREKREATP